MFVSSVLGEAGLPGSPGKDGANGEKGERGQRRSVSIYSLSINCHVLVFVSTGHAIHSSCSGSTIKVKKPFTRSSRGCRHMLTIQEKFATSNYPAASDALQLLHSACYPIFPWSFCQLLRKTPHLQLPQESEAPVDMYATSGKGTLKRNCSRHKLYT